MIKIFALAERPALRRVIDGALAARAVLFMGRRFVCPCCRWHLRTFTMGGFSLRARHHGYCPRCNSKARHRRVWLYLQQHTSLFEDQIRLFHVSPKYSLSRRLARMPNIDYVGADIANRPNIGLTMDVTAVPVRSSSIDAVICVHVLEHVDDDRAAMQELHRILRPGGWALISVPIRLDQRTYEDASVVTPAAREAAFGETTHVRYYGYDLAERLAGVGFDVTLDRGRDINDAMKRRYGLLDDENIFMCHKPSRAAPA
jgi:SAM-dependent methyltransferase